MKTLGILAGPRKGYATDMVIDSTLKGLKDKGFEVEKISLYDYDIKPCTGCCTCYSTRKCVINDDQKAILEKMDSSDVIVMGSPTYWSNVTSKAKAFIDRMLPFFEMGKTGPIRKSEKPGKVILIATCGMPYPFSHILGIIPGCLRAMKLPFSRTKAKIRTLYCAGMLDPLKSKPSEKLLKKAYKIGKAC